MNMRLDLEKGGERIDMSNMRGFQVESKKLFKSIGRR
jgi:hypothetical protein